MRYKGANQHDINTVGGFDTGSNKNVSITRRIEGEYGSPAGGRK